MGFPLFVSISPKDWNYPAFQEECHIYIEPSSDRLSKRGAPATAAPFFICAVLEFREGTVMHVNLHVG